MPYASVTITSTFSLPATSNIVAMDRVGGKPSTVSLTWSSSTATTDATVQYTLDDPMRVSSSLVVWLFVASSAASSTVGHYGSSTFFDTGVTLAFLNPVAAFRLGSSTLSAGNAVMKVVQGEGM